MRKVLLLSVMCLVLTSMVSAGLSDYEFLKGGYIGMSWKGNGESDTYGSFSIARYIGNVMGGALASVEPSLNFGAEGYQDAKISFDEIGKSLKPILDVNINGIELGKKIRPIAWLMEKIPPYVHIGAGYGAEYVEENGKGKIKFSERYIAAIKWEFR